MLISSSIVLFSDNSQGDVITTQDVYANFGSPPLIDGKITDNDMWIEVPETFGSYPEGDVSIRAKHDGSNLYVLTVTMKYGDYIDQIFFEDDGLSPDRNLDSQNEDSKYVGVSGFPEGYRDAHWHPGWAVDSVQHGGAMGTNDGYSYISEWWLPLDSGSEDDIDVSSNQTLGFGAGWTWGWPGGYDVSPYDPITWGDLHITYDPYPLDPVEIMLNSPSNNSVMQPGRTIDLYIHGTDITANYRVDGGTAVNLNSPYDFSTSGWSEGRHTVVVNAQDSGGYSTSATYYFTIDTTPPEIALISPEDNSYITPGTFIDIEVTDPNLANVYYSINDGSEYTFYSPYNLYTGYWEDGDCKLTIKAVDYAQNTKYESYNFIVDSSPPEISIQNLNEEHIIKPGFILEVSIEDLGVDTVYYSVDGGPDEELISPYQIDSSLWQDGNRTLTIEAYDLAGNYNTSEFFVIVDSIAPEIGINSPDNNTCINCGCEINLSISDPYLDIVLCSLNDENPKEVGAPFNLQTDSWNDGNYKVMISAKDKAENINEVWFNITVDSTPPDISLNSPKNNSYIKGDTFINFSIEDRNIDKVTYSKNSEKEKTLDYPYIIDTSDWDDREYTVSVIAEDLAQNRIENWFVFTKDSISPEIIFNSPGNNSILDSESLIDFDITDLNLKTVEYSLNDGTYKTLDDPYDIPTDDWDDDEYLIKIRAEDEAENIVEPWFLIRFDIRNPLVESHIPKDKEKNIPIELPIVIEFSESMDQESLESAILISSDIEYDLIWAFNNKTLLINFSEPLKYDTTYEITIGTQAEDMAGKGLEDDYSFKFTTIRDPDSIGDFLIPMYLLVLLVIAIVVIVIIVAVVASKKKKTKDANLDPLSQTWEAQLQSQAPSTIQVQCSVCSNLVQVSDTGVTQNVTCPFCSSLIAVESQRTPMQTFQPEPQVPTVGPQTFITSCPHCRSSVKVMDTGAPMQVVCPICSQNFVASSQTAAPSTYAPQPLPGSIMMEDKLRQAKCPKCARYFDVNISQLPMHINCPHCGASGTVGFGS